MVLERDRRYRAAMSASEPNLAFGVAVAGVAVVFLLLAGSCTKNPRVTSPPATTAADPDLLFADLGTCVLEGGARLEPCRVGYRTFGKLNAARSNAVLFPTWFTGTTKGLVGLVPGTLIDTERFFVVLVDALADGVSSSPSNSPSQAGPAFPTVTIRDMVASQRRLVHDVLKIDHLHAVAGISMGGMQAFSWAVEHPDEMDRVVSIVGTPQLTSNDLLLWRAELNALTSDVAYANGTYAGHPSLRAVLDIHELALTTPSHHVRTVSHDAFPKWVEKVEQDVGFDWNDRRRQLEAMLSHDVGQPYGSLEAAARRVHAKLLAVVAAKDHMVNPTPSRTFADLVHGETLVLDSDCGHLALGCARDVTVARVRAFLE